MAKFLLKESRFIKQKGQDFPEYVMADPDHAAIVEMDDEVRVFDYERKAWKTIPFTDARMVPCTETVEVKEHLIPAHADLKQDPVPTAARLQGPTPATPPSAPPPKGAKSARLADG